MSPKPIKLSDEDFAVLARLEALHGPAVHISGKAPAAEREAATRSAIAAGANLIYQGALIRGDWIGFPDFLVKKARNGAIAYEPEDAKLARKVKVEHLLQLGIYAELLADVYGMPVGHGTLHVAGGDPQSLDLTRTRHILKRFMKMPAGLNKPAQAGSPFTAARKPKAIFRPLTGNRLGK